MPQSKIKLAALILISLLLSVILTGVSITIQKVGPEVGMYGNVCGPSGNEPCYQELLKGGFPIPYLFDNPGVSVRGQLSFFEDDFHVFPFILDNLFYIIVLGLVLIIASNTMGRLRGCNLKTGTSKND